MSAERGENFWLPQEHKVSTFESSWCMTKVNGDNDPLTELDYGMAGSLDSGLETCLETI